MKVMRGAARCLRLARDARPRSGDEPLTEGHNGLPDSFVGIFRTDTSCNPYCVSQQNYSPVKLIVQLLGYTLDQSAGGTTAFLGQGLMEVSNYPSQHQFALYAFAEFPEAPTQNQGTVRLDQNSAWDWYRSPELGSFLVRQTRQASSLSYQGVTSKTMLVGNVLDVEMDAAGRTGDWATATYIDSIELENIGTFSSFTMGGSGVAWTPSRAQLNAKGCSGGGTNVNGACAQGTPIALGDNMHFIFTFDASAKVDSTSPYLKVRLLNAALKKQGSLLGQVIA